MKLTATILSMLLSLPPAYTDVEEEGREQRMQVVAAAIAHASTRAACVEPYDDPRCKPIWHRSEVELGALLVTKGWWESRFALNVHEGKCKPYECDAHEWRGTIVHRARSPWQFQRTSYSEDLWDVSVGTDFESTRNAAWVATRVLATGMDHCKNAYGALSWYAVHRCDWSKTTNRFGTYTKLMQLKPREVSSR